MAMGNGQMNVRREVLAEPAADVGNAGKAMVVEIGDDGARDVPLFPAGEFAEAGFAGVEKRGMLAAGLRRNGHISEVCSIGRRIELADEADARVQRALGSDEGGCPFAPYGFAVNLPCLADDTREGETPEGVAAAIVTGDESGVEYVHQNVIPECRSVIQC